MKLLRSLQDSVKKIEKMYADYEDIGLLIEMSEEEPDDETIEEIREDLERFQEEFEELRIGTLLTGEYDRNDAIMSIHAGAGGTESCDWASMLYRMYTRWAEKKGFTVEVLDYLEGDVAGIKGVTFEVRGENGYITITTFGNNGQVFCAPKKAFTVSCGFLRSMRRENVRLLSCPAM